MPAKAPPPHKALSDVPWTGDGQMGAQVCLPRKLVCLLTINFIGHHPDGGDHAHSGDGESKDHTFQHRIWRLKNPDSSKYQAWVAHFTFLSLSFVSNMEITIPSFLGGLYCGEAEVVSEIQIFGSMCETGRKMPTSEDVWFAYESALSSVKG